MPRYQLLLALYLLPFANALTNQTASIVDPVIGRAQYYYSNLPSDLIIDTVAEEVDGVSKQFLVLLRSAAHGRKASVTSRPSILQVCCLLCRDRLHNDLIKLIWIRHGCIR